MKDIPLRIALVGAPGARKSQVAEALLERSKPFFEEADLRYPAIVDDIDKQLTEHGRQVGVYGDHYVSMAYFHARAAMEDRIWSTGDSFISCGTVIDNMAHVNARLTLLEEMAESAVVTELQLRERTAGNLMATYLADNRIVHHYAAYVPLPEDVLEEGREKGSFNVIVDASLRQLMQRMGVVIPTLTAETPEDMADEVFGQLTAQYKKIVEDTQAERAAA